MNVIIIEDEPLAAQYLCELLNEIDSLIQIEAILPSVKQAVDWLANNSAHLIFMDINLGDQIAFEIFQHIESVTPIIFTTAFDNYAVQAFKVNGLDYLIKPVNKEELQASIEKYKHLYAQQATINLDYQRLIQDLEKQNQSNYKKRFLVGVGERLKSVTIENIAYFYAEQRYVVLVTNQKEKFIVDHTIEALEKMLDPLHFFRVNRQFIIHFQSIQQMYKHTRSRLKLELFPPINKSIIVATERSGVFKEWLNR
ncbi:hypothetical protein BKI52_01780 [marine bacterium AO1-C]|nr:hypothetical protein BKI52_01780 [marine bacterium AO1-C]